MNFPKPKKSLGQNFLKDKGIIKEMVSLLDIKKGEIVIEIGPGTGVITNYLLESGAQVIAVEYDESLADKLENDYRGNDQIKIQGEAALKLIESVPQATGNVGNNINIAV